MRVTRSRRRSYAAGRTRVRVRIRDEGRGIPDADLERIFEPFFRGRSARADQVEGSGLGLSVVKRVVEAHGGRVEVSSEPGEGSTFIVDLPAAGHGRAGSA